jgi:hypothetical protein
VTQPGGALALPTAPHLPGRNPRPPETFFAPLKAGIVPGMTPSDLAQSAAFAAGFTLFEAGYFWEAHEVWEAVWLRLPPASRERHLMQGLIQLANVGLKRRMGRVASASRILTRADSALAEAHRGKMATPMGVSAAHGATLRQRALEEMCT